MPMLGRSRQLVTTYKILDAMESDYYLSNPGNAALRYDICDYCLSNSGNTLHFDVTRGRHNLAIGGDSAH